MHEIGELQRRITAALDRIGTGVEAIEAPAGPPRSEADMERLTAALDGERRTVSELRDQIESMKAAHERDLDAAQGALAEAQAVLAEVEADRNRLRAANEALGEAARSLRDAGARGVSDAELMNTAALAEIDALKTMRASDRAELDALLRLISPVVEMQEETSDA